MFWRKTCYMTYVTKHQWCRSVNSNTGSSICNHVQEYVVLDFETTGKLGCVDVHDCNNVVTSV